jgi:hypothetical protein
MVGMRSNKYAYVGEPESDISSPKVAYRLRIPRENSVSLANSNLARNS